MLFGYRPPFATPTSTSARPAPSARCSCTASPTPWCRSAARSCCSSRRVRHRRREGFVAGVVNAVFFGAGMGLVVIALTVTPRRSPTTRCCGALRSAMRYVDLVAAAFVLLSGLYLLYYFGVVDVERGHGLDHRRRGALPDPGEHHPRRTTGSSSPSCLAAVVAAAVVSWPDGSRPAPAAASRRERTPAADETVPARPAATVMLVRDADAGRHRGVDGAAHGERRLRRGDVRVPRRPGRRRRRGAPTLAPSSRRLDDATASAALGIDHGGLAYWVAAIRECFEEAGLLLARSVDGRLPGDRRRPQGGPPRRAVDGGAVPPPRRRARPRAIRYVAHWVTPVGEVARRFDTRFFLAAAPPGRRAATTTPSWSTAAGSPGRRARQPTVAS